MNIEYNAIEGNTLTINKTKGSRRNHCWWKNVRFLNHQDAIHYVEEIVQKGDPLSGWQIKNGHGLVLTGGTAA
ncbi:hypothetical protein MM221_12950 [Salipaludibacillus sp. LMS25]|jgi:hypothetical protein|uniref:hypothetical protein n=1 Tax=Salipaludibacillus sp. LMS25 TaxID=2924031 RepID=UPI0020D08AC7|nr:hypothetical protein [Salipaludibacillus sp. LMS25]UTR13532.1 hypothetical protein MM221_12950 [Salipaludibacillus sp. LMS25]